MEICRIEDDTIVEALRQHGFTCEKSGAGEPEQHEHVSTPRISFIFRSLEEEQEQEATARKIEASNRWYETDCPIEWGKTYTLPDGRILVLHGTCLVWQAEYQKMEERRGKR